MTTKHFLFVAAACLSACSGQVSDNKSDNMLVDSLGIKVTASENREYSYTDKKAGYWYGTTHQDSLFFWSGWNMAKKRILADYSIGVDDEKLDRKKAVCTVFPERLERIWLNSNTGNDASDCLAKEDFYLLDNRPVIYISIEAPHNDSIYIDLDMSHISDVKRGDNGLMFVPNETPDKYIMLSTASGGKYNVLPDGSGIKAESSEKGFILVYGSLEECNSLTDEFRTKGSVLLAERKKRINDLITVYNPTESNSEELNKALDWITITTDELITEQQGKGIYAGLPWFNEYWGRDMFISMPGACLVTGQFDVARQILLDFAKLQDKDPESETYGRIPNRANLEGILYNTTDGTPRFVIQAYELLEYSGDTTFIKDIYPSVKISIDASLDNYTDDKGYLTHADADTWMDVKRNGIPGSPRGNRANDIQALWYGQLMAGSKMAEMMNDMESAGKWQKMASKLKSNFESDYCDKKNILIFDHLNSDGTQDLQFRPNQLYCFDLIDDTIFKKKVTRRVWEELVYPWGVASLAQWDKQFHPQHENWHYYHKDDAYHNGTIWLWNNGIAMQRMLEYGQVETAWKLFKNMNRQALYEGAVGSLSENADAHPREGKSWVNRSGTFLQAWSNAEHLRVWYQYFLGIRPDMMNRTVVVDPKIPEEITYLRTSVKIGKGTLYYEYKNGNVNVRIDGDDLKLNIVPKQNGDSGNTEVSRSEESDLFDGVDFCKVNPLDKYPCFDVYHEPALTY